MATMPQLETDHVVTAADWNAHVDQINANTSGIASNSSTISSHTTSINTLNTRTTSSTIGNQALYDNRTAGGGFGSLYQATSQGFVANSTDPGNARIIWDSVDGALVNVTRSDNNRTITVNKSGVWLISVFARLSPAFAANRLVLWLGPPTSGTSDRYGFAMIQPNTSLADPGTSFTIQKRFNAGDSFSAYLYHDAGTSTQNTLTTYRSTAMTLAYLGAA